MSTPKFPLQITSKSTSTNVRVVLETNGVFPDVVSKNQQGQFVFRKEFFLTRGQSAQKYAEMIQAIIHGVRIIKTEEIWKTFRGGAPTHQQSHFLVVFEVKP